MRIEVRVHEDTDPLLFVDFLQNAAHKIGYRLLRNSGELVGFQATIVVEPAYTKMLNSEVQTWSPQYISLSTEMYKLSQRDLDEIERKLRN